MDKYFAFNIWSIETAKAVIDGCAKFGNNALLQTSMKAYEQLDKQELRDFVNKYALSKGVKVFLHLDHCKDIKKIEEAINYGWDSVMIDGSDKEIEENIELTRQVIEIARPKKIYVEAEIGQITGSKGVASFVDVQKFLANVTPDLLAVAIGTAHGLYKGTPVLDYDLLKKVIEYTDIPLVIHGGTGLSDEEFLKLLSYEQVKKINISTDVKMAYREAILKAYENGDFEQNGFDPLAVSRSIHDNIQRMVEHKQHLLNGGRK